MSKVLGERIVSAGGRLAGSSIRVAAILGLLVGCAVPDRPDRPPVSVGSRQSPLPVAAASAPAASAPATSEPLGVSPLPRPVLTWPRSRWTPVAWTDLPGWQGDAGVDLWIALARGCTRPAAAWQSACRQALAIDPLDEAARRHWVLTRLRPYRVDAVGTEPSSAPGLLTGYFEPEVPASRSPDARRKVPLYALPADKRRVTATRRQIDSDPAVRAVLRAIAYVEDPLDALLLQIQGSGRLRLADDRGGTGLVRIAFAAHNDQPYQSVGRWLIDQGELPPGAASWPAIRDWARRHPDRIDEMLWSNPRVVFFREELLGDPEQGPRGAQGVPLTAGRSLAVDPQSIPYGTPLWFDAIDPRDGSPWRRLGLAQDTGGAITGAIRADLFCGWGDAAESLAGRLRSPLRLWALWPVDAADDPAAAR
jgi:membrane-bound lytic murein transglycosylase A